MFIHSMDSALVIYCHCQDIISMESTVHHSIATLPPSPSSFLSYTQQFKSIKIDTANWSHVQWKIPFARGRTNINMSRAIFTLSPTKYFLHWTVIDQNSLASYWIVVWTFIGVLTDICQMRWIFHSFCFVIAYIRYDGLKYLHCTIWEFCFGSIEEWAKNHKNRISTRNLRPFHHTTPC